MPQITKVRNVSFTRSSVTSTHLLMIGEQSLWNSPVNKCIKFNTRNLFCYAACVCNEVKVILLHVPLQCPHWWLVSFLVATLLHVCCYLVTCVFLHCFMCVTLLSQEKHLCCLPFVHMAQDTERRTRWSTRNQPSVSYCNMGHLSKQGWVYAALFTHTQTPSVHLQPPDWLFIWHFVSVVVICDTFLPNVVASV